MRALLMVVGLVGATALASGCGEKDRPENADPGTSAGRGGKASPPAPSKGGSSNTGGSDGGGGEGGSAEEVVDPLGPTVTITSPEPLDDPNDGEVLSGSLVSVTCSVKQSEVNGSTAVDATSVKLARLEEGKVVDEKPGMLGEDADTFTTTFALAEAEAGRVQFRCQAQSSDKHIGFDEVSTLLDKGPAITIAEPVAEVAFPLTTPLKVEFSVAPAKLSDDDEGSAIANVSLEIGGVLIDLDGAETSPGNFSLDVDLTDATLFNPAPSGPLPVVVKATNKREPNAVAAEVTHGVKIDGVAPVLTITSPVAKAVIGGQVMLRFTAADAVSGVDPTSVHVSLNDEDEYYDPKSDAWHFADGTFTYEFDSRQVKGSLVQVTVRIGATDKVGNTATIVSQVLYLDNHPPLIDMDPAAMRTYDADGKCSRSFDPLGPRALNDLQNVQVAGTFRAIIWDDTNSAPGIPVVHLSCTNQASARLYVRRATEADALLVDTNMDGVCDDVSDVDNKDAVVLNPIPRAGAPWSQPGDEAVPPSMASLGCTNPAPPAELPTLDPPDTLCTNQASDMYQVIEHTLTKDDGTKEPVVYAQEVTANQECTGIGWEFTGLFKHEYDGWVCVAVRAVDNAGNVGVSRPLRLCVDDPGVSGSPDCLNSSVEPPSCTNSCTPPEGWNVRSLRWR